MKGDNQADIESKTAALSAAAQKLGERMYAHADDAGQPPEDVVDADFKEVRK